MAMWDWVILLQESRTLGRSIYKCLMFAATVATYG